jgi:hypothetical protein
MPIRRLLQMLFTISIAVGAVISAGGLQARVPAQSPALTNGDVVKMTEAKLSDDIIVSKIRSSACAFDMDIDAILKLKATGVSDAVIHAMVDTTSKRPPNMTSGEQTSPPDLNDPKSPHEAGIYWLSKTGAGNRMIQLEAASYSQTSATGFAASSITLGLHKAKNKAVFQGAHAALRIREGTPEFWFYFTVKSQGLERDASEASKPEEFVLAKMEAGSDKRQLIVGQLGVTGVSSGTRPEDAVRVDTVKVAPGIYKVKPVEPLKPGEYCFVPPGGAASFGVGGGRVFDFGIDRAE